MADLRYDLPTLDESRNPSEKARAIFQEHPIFDRPRLIQDYDTMSDDEFIKKYTEGIAPIIKGTPAVIDTDTYPKVGEYKTPALARDEKAVRRSLQNKMESLDPFAGVPKTEEESLGNLLSKPYPEIPFEKYPEKSKQQKMLENVIMPIIAGLDVIAPAIFGGDANPAGKSGQTLKDILSSTEALRTKGKEEFYGAQKAGQEAKQKTFENRMRQFEVLGKAENMANLTDIQLKKLGLPPRKGKYQYANARGITPKDEFDMVTKIRASLESNPKVKDFSELNRAYTAMNSVWDNYASNPGKKQLGILDQSLITLYNKITDPSSVVRESEYNRTPEGMAAWDRFVAGIDKWKKGGAGIDPAYRKEIIDNARLIVNGALPMYQDAIVPLKMLVDFNALNSDQVFSPIQQQIAEGTYELPVPRELELEEEDDGSKGKYGATLKKEK